MRVIKIMRVRFTYYLLDKITPNLTNAQTFRAVFEKKAKFSGKLSVKNKIFLKYLAVFCAWRNFARTNYGWQIRALLTFAFMEM